jgi:xylulokinase
MTLVVGVDSSTQSTKVEVRDLETGVLVATGRAAHPPTGSAPVSESDPAAWWTAFEEAWAVAGAPEVAAISVAGQQHGCVALDAAGDVIRPAMLWNDTRSAPDAGWCVKQRGAEWWAHEVGSVPVASFTVTKLSLLHRSEPEAWDRIARLCLPHDYLTWRLRGSGDTPIVTDRGDASGTGYWSARTGSYQAEILSIIDKERDWSGVMPAVAGPLERAGTWGSAVVGPGTGDNMAAALGVGLRPGDVCVSIGTSGTVFTVSDTPTADASGAVAGFADATGRYLPLVCTLNAGKVIDTVARLLGVDHEHFSALALEADAEAGRPVLLPYFDGERTPNRPKATGVFSGLRHDITREALARSVIEGVLCGLIDGIDALAAAGAAGDGRVVLVGGGARMAAVPQILADLTGRPVEVCDTDELVALGAARQAAAVLTGGWPSWAAGVGVEVAPTTTADQRAEVRERYAERREREA